MTFSTKYFFLVLFLSLPLVASDTKEKPKPEICFPPNEKNYPDFQLPITDITDAECANNTTEWRALFPNVSEKLVKLEGSWTDGNFRNRVKPLPKEKQYKDKSGSWIVNDVDMSTITYRFNANKSGIFIQEQSDDKKNVSTVSEAFKSQLCKKGTSIFIKTSSAFIPVAFPSKRCMWIGSKGKWFRFWRYNDLHYAFSPATKFEPAEADEVPDSVAAPSTPAPGTK